MSYKRERMGRTDDPSARSKRIESLKSLYADGPRRPLKRDRGTKFTMLSFALAGAAIIFIKKMRPEADISRPMMMLAAVMLGCLVMAFIARRIR